jgi:L-iditol 2-dehydrogenase
MAPSLVEPTTQPQPTTEPESLLNGTKQTISSHPVTEVDTPSKVDNPSVQVTADHTIRMVEAPILKPGPADVLLHIKVTGICGYSLISPLS